MPYVICKLPNAAEEINGVKFEKAGHVMVSVEQVDDDVAALFAGIDGYELADAKPKGGEKAAQDDAPAEQENAPAEQEAAPKTGSRRRKAAK